MVQISKWQVAVAISGGLILISITLFFTVKPKIQSNRARVWFFAIGLVLSVGISVAFSFTVNEVLAGITLYVGVVYFTFMLEFVSEYTGFVSKSLTFKEALSRKKTAKEFCLEDNLKGGKETFIKSLKAHYEFFMIMQIPISNLSKLH